MLGAHGERPSVGEPAVEALAHDHVHRVPVARGTWVQLEQVAQSSLPHRAHREGVREQQRALDRSELDQLREPRGLAVPVHHVAAAKHLVLIEVAVVREDRGHARAQTVALDERAMAHAHARHVDERVQLTRRKAADRITQLT